MLHTRTHKSRMAIMIKQLMPECTSCVARVHSGLCSNRPQLDLKCGTGVNRGNGRENIRHNWTPSVVQELTEEMAERISATIGQEYYKAPTREMLKVKL